MMFDSESTTLKVALFLGINLAPFIFIVVVTFFALRKNSLLIASLPLVLFIATQIGSISIGLRGLISIAPKSYIVFGKNIPSENTLFVCPKGSVFKIKSLSIYEVTKNVTRNGWKDAGIDRYVGKVEYNKLVLSDESDRYKIETCKNPNDDTIASIVSSMQPSSLTDISFSGLVPTSTLYFVCPNEKVLELGKDSVLDITHFVTKDGWKPQESRVIATFLENRPELIIKSELHKNATMTCKNIEGKTIPEVTIKTPLVLEYGIYDR